MSAESHRPPGAGRAAVILAVLALSGCGQPSSQYRTADDVAANPTPADANEIRYLGKLPGNRFCDVYASGGLVKAPSIVVCAGQQSVAMGS